MSSVGFIIGVSLLCKEMKERKLKKNKKLLDNPNNVLSKRSKDN